MKLAICDDMPEVIEQIESFIEKYSDNQLEYDIFFSGEELFEYITKTKSEYDIYILDIEMKGKSGLEFAKQIRKISPYSLIVFLTSFPQYVYDVFEVVTFDFIVKPLEYERFLQLLNKISQFLQLTKANLTFGYRKNKYSIPCRNIVYIEKSGRKAYIHTKSGKIYQCNITLCELWKQIDSKFFAPIHISCVVNLSEIMEIEREKLVLKNGEVLYIGRKYKQEIKTRHLQFLKGYL